MHQRAIVIIRNNELMGDALVNMASHHAFRSAFPAHRIVAVYRIETVLNGPMARIRDLLCDDVIVGAPVKDVEGCRRVFDSIGNIDAIVDFRTTPRVVSSFRASFGSAHKYVANTPYFVLRRGVSMRIEPRPRQNYLRAHRMVEILAGAAISINMSIPPDPGALAQAQALLPAGKRYVGFVPGRFPATKFWPLERMIATARAAAARDMTPVFFIGPFETQIGDVVRRDLASALVVDVKAVDGDETALFWLVHAAAIRLTCCIATGGGLGHLLASQGVPLVTVTNNPKIDRWQAFSPNIRIVHAREFGGTSMDAIPVEAVVKALWTLLDAHAA